MKNEAVIQAYAVSAGGRVTPFPISTGPLTGPEREIIASGCLINYYRSSET